MNATITLGGLLVGLALLLREFLPTAWGAAMKRVGAARHGHPAAEPLRHLQELALDDLNLR